MIPAEIRTPDDCARCAFTVVMGVPYGESPAAPPRCWGRGWGHMGPILEGWAPGEQAWPAWLRRRGLEAVFHATAEGHPGGRWMGVVFPASFDWRLPPHISHMVVFEDSALLYDPMEDAAPDIVLTPGHCTGWVELRPQPLTLEAAR